MPLQTINIGASANDGTGDPLRTAFDKVNDNFLAVGSYVFNVRDPAFAGGAVGNGVTDDTAAIQAAIDAMRAAISTAIIPQGYAPTLRIPNGIYLTTDTLDLTAIRAMNWVLDAEGAIIFANCTGKPVIDMLDCRWWDVYINIWGDQTNTPSIGIQFGRARTGAGNDAGDGTFSKLNEAWS